MLLIITSTGDELLRNVNIDDLELPATLKILTLSDFVPTTDDVIAITALPT